MAVDKHPSRAPALPKKPPATSTTSGSINKIPAHLGSAQGGGDYGFRHELSVKPAAKSEMSAHFYSTGADGSAGKVGKEAPNEGTVSRASKVGSETDKNDIAK